MQIKDRVFLITGASSGLGAAVAKWPSMPVAKSCFSM